MMRQILLLLTLAMGAALATPSSAIIANDKTSYITDVQTKLANVGVATDVFNINLAGSAPNLAQLQQYSSVLVWTSKSCFFSVCSNLGDALDAYVRAGGVVVIATFASHNDPAYEVAGAFLANDDWAIEPGAYSFGSELTLGTVHVPLSSLMAGVSTLDGGTSTSYTGTVLNAAAIGVADWSNGAPLIAYRQVGSGFVISLNMYPVSSDKFSTGWKPNTDGARLMANALQFKGGGLAVPEPGTLVTAGLALLWLSRRRRSDG